MNKFAILLLLPLTLFGKSIMSQQDDYISICKRAAKDPAVFANFRRNRAIIRCIEGTPFHIGKACLKKTPDAYKNKLHLLQDYESLGRPKRHHYPDYGDFSSCTLRYVMILADLKKRFGPLDAFHITEIGGGYGGQCAVISLMESKKHYTLIDLPCVLNLANRFLDCLKIHNVSYIRHDQLEQAGNCDLLISNYAFSEIESKHQLEYLEKVISKAQRGYMVINFTGASAGIQSLRKEEIQFYLENCGHQVKIDPELVQSNPAKPNVVLTWGNDLLNNE